MSTHTGLRPLHIPVIPEQPIQYAMISQSDSDCAVSPIKLIKRLAPQLPAAPPPDK